ncbi:DNA mismatch repair endonuclease MutL [bacterium SCSIO 12741]|nr:DNA mismatch repair endonuclease MutL [bacterium SCSIO 12741]
MNDVIKLLPDAVANQIAAGEVVQRPASVVKELMENAIDAGADQITVVIKNAGKNLIQVIDNGSGMSPTDLRMSIERHATSKINDAQDLFRIRTMGFRGEALASITAVAQCEIKSRQADTDIGTCLMIDGSEIKSQEPCSHNQGTSIAVKNLFFNIPARRKFLKSNSVESKHIIDQFERIALIYPAVQFRLFSDDNELFHLNKGNYRQRIVAIFGKNYNDRLVPMAEESNIISLEGFIGKPENARKTRGEQYFFVNDRFIKNNYLHHAVTAAFDELIPEKYHPSYFIRFTCDPSFVDINIHPTKTEVKFEDDKSVYAILRSSVKKALGEHNIAPTLDFNRETAFDDLTNRTEVVPPSITVNPEFNPFESKSANTSFGGSSGGGSMSMPKKQSIDNWETLYPETTLTQQEVAGMPMEEEETRITQKEISGLDQENPLQTDKKFFQLHNRYILSQIKSGVMIIDQQRAHERILFEQFLHALAHRQGTSQQSLFPVTLEYAAGESELIRGFLPELNQLGFDLEEFGKNTFIVRGVPAELSDQDAQELLDGILENYQLNAQELKLDARVNVAFSLAQKGAIKRNRPLEPTEIQNLIDSLFACENPYATPSGKLVITTLYMDELNKRFD